MSKRTKAKQMSQDALHRQQRAIERLSQRLAGKGLTYSITTMGCQMNAHDSEKLKGVLEAIGYTETLEEAKADFILYNTCAVRENAELKVYGKVGNLKNLKRKKPTTLIALCGCMMQQDVVISKLKQSYHYIDIVFGTHNIYKLAELIETRLDTNEAVYDIWEEHQEIVEDLPSIRKSQHKASVNIMYGCNNFCSYCIVPYVRGRERSRYPEDIILEVKKLVADGVKEVVLLGQNVNSYGVGLDIETNFANLLKEVAQVKGLKRLRFMTPHPKDLSIEVMKVMAEEPVICNQLHLPIQSGSTKLLQAMNRKYTKASYLELVKKARELIPEVSLSTDIIVGFPGETEADFLETMDVVEQAKYSTAFTFIYSKRTGTPAANMEDQIEESVIKDRFNRLLEKLNGIIEMNSKAHIGGTYEVLVDQVDTHKAGYLTGRLRDNYLVHFKGSSDLIGELVDVRIESARTFYLNGVLEEEQSS